MTFVNFLDGSVCQPDLATCVTEVRKNHLNYLYVCTCD